MKVKQMPFNLKPIDSATVRRRFLVPPVTELGMFENSTGDFNPNGLYSNVIFGQQGDERRFKQVSYIDLKTSIFHPFYLKQLRTERSLYYDIVMGRQYALWDEKENDFIKSDIISGQSGYSFFLEHFKKIAFKSPGNVEKEQRQTFLRLYREKALLQDYIIIPAGIRDVDTSGDRPVEDDINPLYRALLAQANTLSSITAKDNNDPTMDSARRSLTIASEKIFNHIWTMLEGKRGLLQSEFASRQIFGTTRNVISTLDAATVHLDDPRSTGIQTTIVGVTQFMAAIRPQMRRALRNGIAKEFIESIKDNPILYNKETFRKERVKVSEKVVDKWSTAKGLDEVMASFLEPGRRHSPIEIAGNYLGLIYRDEKGFKIVKDISRFPQSKMDKVKPITWGELFYIEAAQLVDGVRGVNTRYPVTGLGSTFVSKTYLKSTGNSQRLHRYSDDWELDKEFEYLEFPDVNQQAPFHDTMVVHTATLKGLGADFDGDMLSWSAVWSKESIAEIDKYLNSKECYITAGGKLAYSMSDDIMDWVMFNTTF